MMNISGELIHHAMAQQDINDPRNRVGDALIKDIAHFLAWRPIKHSGHNPRNHIGKYVTLH